MNAVKYGPVLVIGCGNSLHGDDGAGRSVTEIIESWKLPSVRTINVSQFTPEVAAEMAAVRHVIFVDAYHGTKNGPVRIARIKARASDAGHSADPAGLLDLAGHLYGHRPDAWMVSVPGVAFDHHKSLSKAAEVAVRDAAVQVKGLALRAFLQPLEQNA